MKKLLSIIVLGLLLSGNAYAAKKYKATAMHYYGSERFKAIHSTGYSEAENLAIKQ